MRPDDVLHAAGDRQSVLGQLLLERQRLPAVRVAHHRARVAHEHRVVGRRVAAVDVPLVLEGSVVATGLDDRGSDAVAEGGRCVSVGRLVVGPVAQRRHHRVELFGGDRKIRDRAVAPEQEPIDGEADRRLPRGDNVVGVEFLGDEVAVSGRVVRRPGVPHRHRGVEQVAGVHRRSRDDLTDQLEQRIVPHAGDRPTAEVGALASGDLVLRFARRVDRRCDPDQSDDDGGDAAPRPMTPPHVRPPQFQHRGS